MVLFGYQVFDPLKSGCPARWKMPPVTLDELGGSGGRNPAKLFSFLSSARLPRAYARGERERSLANITQTINHARLCLLARQEHAVIRGRKYDINAVYSVSHCAGLSPAGAPPRSPVAFRVNSRSLLSAEG